VCSAFPKVITFFKAKELVRIMGENGGYCATGAQESIREGKAVPSCLSSADFSFDDENTY
jgi:hypothetical protein